jgi:hypothetical protein
VFDFPCFVVVVDILGFGLVVVDVSIKVLEE